MPAHLHSDKDNELDFSEIFQKHKVEFNDSLDNLIVVDNLPVVDDAKYDKLMTLIKKLFKSAGNLHEDSIFMPKQSDKSGKSKTKGFLFLEYDTAEQASNAIKAFNGHRLDKTHVFAVNRLSDLSNFQNYSDEFVPPEDQPFEKREYLKSWLSDTRARDQFVIHRHDQVSIYWNMKTNPPDLVYNRMNWTESYVQWSPKGSYLTTLHRQGVALWGGASWNKIIRFIHADVKLIDFSPNEEYLVTWSNEPLIAGVAPASAEDEGNQIIVWEVKTGRLLRSFPFSVGPDGDKSAKIVWPVFQWSCDSRYLARLIPGEMISVYEAPSMNLLDKKSIKIDGVKEFQWSKGVVDPKANPSKQKHYLSYWTPEVNNQPARVTVMSIPDRQIVRTKNLFNVNDCKLHWQSNGDFLCVRVERHTKTKKVSFSNLEIFRIREKDVPVEVLEIKDQISTFAWEPEGRKFVIISSKDPTQKGANNSVSFYSVEAKDNTRHIKTVERKTLNTIYWSPKGRFVVLACMQSNTSAELEFWDTEVDVAGQAAAITKGDKDGASVQLMAAGEHFMMTDVEWDPTGRFVLTSISTWRHANDNGYILWDFKGTTLNKVNMDRLKQIMFRPRPPTLLSEKQKKDIRKNLKEYSKKFDEEDLSSQKNVSAQALRDRRQTFREWQDFRKESLQKYFQLRDSRRQLLRENFDEFLERKLSKEWQHLHNEKVDKREDEEPFEQIVEYTEEIVE